MAQWVDYDPSWLIELAREQKPKLTWLPDALAQCTRAMQLNKSEFEFVAREEWQFEKSVVLRSAEHGLIVIDLLKGQKVGGIKLHGGVAFTCRCGFMYTWCR